MTNLSNFLILSLTKDVFTGLHNTASKLSKARWAQIVDIMTSLFSRMALIIFALSLIACGGGGGGPDSPSIPDGSNGVVLTTSSTSVTISGKQFADPEQPVRVDLNYSRDIVNIITLPRRFTNPDFFDDADIFRASMDSAQEFIDISSAKTDLEGGTYTDELVVTPLLRDGGEGATVTISLTLVQEPTVPITTTPADISATLTENGPAIRIPITINAGNTVRWRVEPYSFQAESVEAITSDPTTGTGSQEIDIVITPTPLLVSEIREQDNAGFAFIGFEDLDAPRNFFELGVNLTLND